MPIHFSIGFVAESMPRKQYVTVCADAVEQINIDAAAVVTIETQGVIISSSKVKSFWVRQDGKCK